MREKIGNPPSNRDDIQYRGSNYSHRPLIAEVVNSIYYLRKRISSGNQSIVLRVGSAYRTALGEATSVIAGRCSVGDGSKIRIILEETDSYIDSVY